MLGGYAGRGGAGPGRVRPAGGPGDCAAGRCGPVPDASQGAGRDPAGGHRGPDPAGLGGDQEHPRPGQRRDLGGLRRPDGADLHRQRRLPVDQRPRSGGHPHRPNEEKGFRTEEVKEQLRKELPERLQPWLAKRLHATYGASPDVAASACRASGGLLRAGRRDQPGHELRLADAGRGGHQRAQPGRQPQYAEKVIAEMRKIPTLRDLQFGQAFDYPRIKVDIDRERAGLAGVTVAEAANAMIAATSSSRYIMPVFWADPKSGIGYQVQLQVPPAQMNSHRRSRHDPVKQNEDGAPRCCATWPRSRDSTMPQEYDRINQRRIVSITANVVGEDLGRAVDRIEAGHHGGRRPAARREGRRRSGPYPRPGAAHAADVQRPGQRPGAGRGGRVPDAHRLFPVGRAGVGVGGDDAGGGGGRGLRPVHHRTRR